MVGPHSLFTKFRVQWSKLDSFNVIHGDTVVFCSSNEGRAMECIINGLEDADAAKEKIQESTSINLDSKPQGLKWIDFDYNNNNEAEKEETIEFELSFGGNFYGYDYDHVIFPRSPKAIVVVP